jgi:hypothetical protein
MIGQGRANSTAARLSLTRVQFIECALQLFKLLPSLAELAFRRQALVVGKVSAGFRNERIEFSGRLGRRASRPLGGGCRGIR